MRTPSVTAASDGSYTVSYQFFDSSTLIHDLVFVNVDAAGVVGTQTTGVAGSGSTSLGGPSARLTNGDIALVYRYETIDDAIAFSVRNPETGASPTGGFVIAWSSTTGGDTDIHFQCYNNSGTVQGGVTTVASDGSSDDNTEVTLVALADGGFLVLWNDGEAGQEAGRGQRYDATGATVGAVFSFDSSNANHIDAVLLDDGRVALTWQNGEIHAAILDTRDVPNGTAVYAPDSYVIGTPGDDDFTADSSADFVYGHDGDDTIHESGPTRSYFGGPGSDLIYVNSEINSDEHYGGRGNDTIDWSGDIFETPGFTLVFDLRDGTATSDFGTEVMKNFENLIGTEERDEIYGTDGANVLSGNRGSDLIKGRGGDDTLAGGGGQDRLEGGKGKDGLDGGSSLDDLRGGGGDDILKGRPGSDTLNGNKGDDVLVGGGASDTFDFVKRFGNDKIRDFAENNNAEDIDLSGVGAIKDFQDLENNHMYQDGSDVVIHDHRGNTITVLAVSLGDMNKGDFIF